MDDENKPNKSHRKRQSGVKAEKKKAKNKHDQELTPRQRNPKAFSIQHVSKTLRIVQRTQDIKTKKQHIPVVDRTPIEPPPVVVAIVGPPKVGKSTLLRCVVKNYTKQKLSNIQGPVTVVSGKHRRLTLLECNNDINAMIDVAKVADLVLLLVDASFGFEMETFEFLNICQVHGFPRIMGVLTHLDTFKDNKKQRKTKKRLKHRFWTEVYQGAKLFYLSGMVHGEYQRTEVHNLCRFISVMKFRPLVWRTTHPYILADRMEDITDPEKVRKSPKGDRNISLYGYVHGTHLKNNINVHIPGCGDFSIKDMQYLSDPCPMPGSVKRKTLNQKERMIYAPMSGVGGIVYDKDAVYIDLGGNQQASGDTQEELRPANELVSSLLTISEPVDKKMTTSDVTLFSEGMKLTSTSTDTDTSPDFIRKVVSEGKKSILVQTEDGRFRRMVDFDENNVDSSEEEDSDDEEEDENADSDEGIQKDLPPPKKKMKKAHEDEEVAFADTDDEIEESDVVKASKQKTLLKSKKPESQEITNKIKKGSSLNKSNVTKTAKEVNSENEDDSSEDSSDIESDDSEDETSDIDNFRSGNTKVVDNISDSESSSDSDSEDSENENGNQSKDQLSKKSDTVESDMDSSNEGIESEKGSSGLASRLTSLAQADVDSLQKAKTSYSELEISESAKSKYKYLKRRNEGDSDVESDSDNDLENIIRNKEEEEEVIDVDEEDDDDDDDEDDNDDNDDEDEEGGLKWKSNLASQAAEAFRQRQASRINYRKLVYGQDESAVGTEEEDEDEIGGLFKVLREKSEKTKTDRATINKTDCSKSLSPHTKHLDIEEIRELIVDCFVSGKWDKSEDAAFQLQQDDDMFGDFEDLETGEVHAAKDSDDGEDSGDDNEDDEGADKQEGETEEKKKKWEMTKTERRAEKKKKLKDMFDTVYDMKGDTEYYDTWKSEMEDQAKMNRSEFEHMDDEMRVQYEGFRPGMYVRVEVHDMPCEFVTNFDPTYPLILGGLLSIENNVGYVQTRIKKHRWHKKILKTKNPLIFSVGWRRFQSMPLYSIQDHNLRNRLLKYTPQHLHCHGTFWGPITPQGTGVLAVESLTGANPGFRIAATGVILELDKSMQIVKKLKLTGTPLKIFAKSAFIQGMFNSALEVSKFEGASIRTVSGIRGQIKKVAKSPEGAFRAKFEDKILMSDIVFLRTWYPVSVPHFYNPVTSLLLPSEEKQVWQGLKTVGQLRREKGMKTPMDDDSKYKKIQRTGKTYTPLSVPKSLQQMLPFKDTPRTLPGKKDTMKRVAVIREPHEVKIAKMMKMLKQLHDHKQRTERQQMKERVKKHKKKMRVIEQTRSVKQKEQKKLAYKALGRAEEKSKKHMKD